MTSPGSGYDLKTQLQMQNAHSVVVNGDSDGSLGWETLTLFLRAGEKVLASVCSVTRTYCLVA